MGLQVFDRLHGILVTDKNGIGRLDDNKVVNPAECDQSPVGDRDISSRIVLEKRSTGAVPLGIGSEVDG